MSERPRIAARPYRMTNQVQNYAWGTRDEQAFIPHLLGIEPETGVPYAELWLGTHPKAPSSVSLPDGSRTLLRDLIDTDLEAALGSAITQEFGELPFLLKVLSAGQSLSIQAHPTKAQAVDLHRADPAHYPDDNHKPEIAIALDQLTALVGFKPLDQLARALSRHPEIADFIGRETSDRLSTSSTTSTVVQGTLVRDLLAGLVQRAIDEPEELSRAVDALAQRLTGAHDHLDEAEQLFLELRGRYGSRDTGLFALFLFNIVHLEAGEAIFTSAGVPHAYLGGNIVECMANSDNVVRVGLTPKFRDAVALLRIADTAPRVPAILNGAPTEHPSGVSEARYTVPTPEFELTQWSLPPATSVAVDKTDTPGVLLVIQGTVTLHWEEASERYAQGASAFLPAAMARYAITSDGGAVVVSATVPA